MITSNKSAVFCKMFRQPYPNSSRIAARWHRYSVQLACVCLSHDHLAVKRWTKGGKIWAKTPHLRQKKKGDCNWSARFDLCECIKWPKTIHKFDFRFRFKINSRSTSCFTMPVNLNELVGNTLTLESIWMCSTWTSFPWSTCLVASCPISWKGIPELLHSCQV